MIAINGVPIAEAKSSPLKKEIEKAMEVIREKKIWTLKFHPAVIKKVVQELGGYVEKHPGGALMLSYGKRASDGFEYEVRYFTNFRIKEGQKQFTPKYYSYNGTISLESKKSADLIYFLTCISGKCEIYEPLKDFQNKPFNKPLYKVDDQLLEIKAKVATERMIAKVNTYIYDDENGLSENDIRQFALSYGLPGAEKDDIIIVTHKLKNYLLVRKAGNYDIKRIKSFLKEVKDTTMVEIRAMVEKALKDNLFVIVEDEGRRAWFDVNDKLEKRSHVVSIPPSKDDKETLIKFFALEDDRKEKLEKYLTSVHKKDAPKAKGTSKGKKDIKIEDV